MTTSAEATSWESAAVSSRASSIVILRVAGSQRARHAGDLCLLSRISEAGQHFGDLVDGGRILDGWRHGPLRPVGDLADGAAQDLSRPGLGQLRDHRRGLEERHRADTLA